MRAIATVLAMIALLAQGALSAASAAPRLIRDAETERTLRMLATPVFEAAGLTPERIRIFIIQNSSINAFVFDPRSMALHTGLIQRFDTPAPLIGVIAHEVGHITGGHLARRAINQRALAGPAALALALGAVAGVASGDGRAAAGVATGGREALRRSFLNYSRSEEASADQAAVSYMSRAGIDPSGLMEVMRLFKGQEVFRTDRLDPFALSHPLSSERISLLERAIKESPTRGATLNAEKVYWFQRMRAKLDGFIERPERTLARLETEADPSSEFNRYRRAVALHLSARPDEALREIDALIAERQRDPFYWELRGQILFESARPEEAVGAYRRALSFAPDESLIAGGLGRALLASGQNAEALGVLEQAARDDPGEARILRDLALAYAQQGREGEAALTTADRMALLGDFDAAALHARRALDLLPRGAPAWRRAQDIADIAKTAARQ